MGKSSRGSRCCHRWHSGGEKEKERGRDGRCLSSPLSLRLWTGFVFHSLMQVRKGNGLTCMGGRDGPERSRATNDLPTMRRSVRTQGGNSPGPLINTAPARQPSGQILRHYLWNLTWIIGSESTKGLMSHHYSQPKGLKIYYSTKIHQKTADQCLWLSYTIFPPAIRVAAFQKTADRRVISKLLPCSLQY